MGQARHRARPWDQGQAGELIARIRRILDARDAGTPISDRAADALAVIGQELSRISAEDRFAPARLAAEHADGYAEGAALLRGRHRTGRTRRPTPGQLTLLPGGKATAAAVAATAAAGIVALGPGAYSDLAHWSPVVATHHVQAVTVPVLSPVGATMLPSSVPSFTRRPPRHPRPSAFAATANPVPSPSSVPVVAQPSPPVPSVRPSAAASGTLDVQTAVCSAQVSGQCSVTFTAVGGPIDWAAAVPDPLTLDQDSGHLEDGQPVTITVYVPGGVSAGTGSVTITAGGQSVTVPVTWLSLPSL